MEWRWRVTTVWIRRRNVVPANILFASWLIGEDSCGGPPGRVFEELPVDRGSDRDADTIDLTDRDRPRRAPARGLQWEAGGLEREAGGLRREWSDAPQSSDGLRGAVNSARIPAQRRPIVATGSERLSAVFFDLDGTLIESEEVWNDAVRQWAAEHGTVASDELLAKTHGLDSHRAMRLIHDSLSWPPDQVEHSVAWVAEAVAATMRAGVVWRPGAVALVSALRAAGVPIALVTSSYREIVEIAIGDSAEIGFDAVVCGDEVASPKPHPEPYLTAARLLDVDVHGCVAIEDSPMGAASARGAGCAVLYVSEAATSPDVDASRTSLVGVDLAMLVQLLADARRQP